MNAAAAQLPLPLGHRPALEREDFLVAPTNAEAVAWLDRWPAWPSHALVLHGPEGCGKSHLAQVFAARVRDALGEPEGGARVIAGRPGLELDPPAVLGGMRAVIVDDADRLVEGGHGEGALFHLYNAAKEAGCSLLLTARRPVAAWGVALPDLASRLQAAPAVDIGPPDDAVMAAVLIKLFADRQMRVGTEVVAYLLRHMERSFAAARAVVAAADRLSLAERRPVTVPLARRLLAEGGRPITR